MEARKVRSHDEGDKGSSDVPNQFRCQSAFERLCDIDKALANEIIIANSVCQDEMIRGGGEMKRGDRDEPLSKTVITSSCALFGSSTL